MFRKLLTTTALSVVMATGAYAQSTAPSNEDMQAQESGKTNQTMTDTQATDNKAAMNSEQYVNANADDMLASNVIGSAVYNGSGEDAETVGDVNDLVIGAEGDIEAYVIGVGGFLGLGEKNVAVSFDNVEHFTKDGETRLIVAASKEELEQAPEYELQVSDASRESADNMASSDTSSVNESTAVYDEQKSTDEATADRADAAEQPQQDTVREETAELNAPAMNRDEAAKASGAEEERMQIATGELSTDQLIGATVYGADQQSVGEIGEIIVDSNDNIEAFVIDVGGFLGIGEKAVAVDPNSLKIMANADGDIQIQSSFTEEQLEGQNEYTREAWDSDRESVIVR
ncbi:PRC-barrel domain-containing protein [Tepidamorphus sp. 3E244]|uniref:PRC-barrel domain-containing protein n=1 Tax=Tepidamorphus sp. 3E244 TaxID=3385498 RepID=UPI0038FC6210